MELFQSIIETTLMALDLHVVAFLVACAILSYRDHRHSKHFTIKVTLHDNNEETTSKS